MLRRISSIGLLVTLMLAGAPPAAMADAFDGCALTGAVLPENTWVYEPLYKDGGGNDVDWFKFTTTTAGHYLITLGRLPADYKLELWGSCSAPFKVSDRSGTSYEEIYAYLPAQRWNVRVTGHGTYSPTPYVVRRKALLQTVQVLSSHSWVDSAGKLHFVGEVLNNTSSARTGLTVRASLYSSANAYLGQVSGPLLRAAAPARRRAPFHVVVTAPAGYHHMSNIFVNGGTVPASSPVAGMVVSPLGPSYASGGLRHFEAAITNQNAFTTTNVTAILKIYNSLGSVTNAGKALTSPSTIAPSSSEYVDVGLAGPWAGLPSWDVEASR